MLKKEIIERYIPIVIIVFFTTIIFRIIESFDLISSHGVLHELLRSEIEGLVLDFTYAGLGMAIFYPFFYLLWKRYPRLTDGITIILIMLGTVSHLLIIKYYCYQLIPLDISVYKYSLREMLYTVKNSDVSLTWTTILIIGLILIIPFLFFHLRRKKYSLRIIRATILFCLIFAGLSIISLLTKNSKSDNNQLNKPVYFYKHSINYFFHQRSPESTITNEEVARFQKMSPTKNYLSTGFPLLHQVDTTSMAGYFFQKFDSAPNIVVLIIEGLNDDFLYPYHGINLMPFMSKLKDRCLYWNRCFTLGERSFAVVPSLLGGLPYGEKGFTFEEPLPRHLSLVSILHAHDYYTTFFYGQGAWFHRKDKFLTNNNIDRIVDNKCFSEKYNKIIVGKDNFFWGYHDKDLFDQSLEIVDTLTEKKRMDIYFTGTTHSPFAIDHDATYSRTLEKFKDNENSRFIETYGKYLKSILFVDDALREFFEKYKKMKAFGNTLFIITGDHPMTELPRDNSLKRYHVPLLIYSDKLKEPQIFTNIVSQLDVCDGILSILRDHFDDLPKMSSSLGDNIFDLEPTKEKWLAFMNDNRDVVDFYHNGYYKNDEMVYWVNQDLSLTPIKEQKIEKRLNEELHLFNTINRYVCKEDKLVEDSLYCSALNCEHQVFQRNYDTIAIKSEYYNLMTTNINPKDETTYEITFNYLSNSNELSLVYQFSDITGKIVSWESSTILNTERMFKEHKRIDLPAIKDSTLKFSSYLWIRDKKEVTISNLRLMAYQ